MCQPWRVTAPQVDGFAHRGEFDDIREKDRHLTHLARGGHPALDDLFDHSLRRELMECPLKVLEVHRRFLTCGGQQRRSLAKAAQGEKKSRVDQDGNRRKSLPRCPNSQHE